MADLALEVSRTSGRAGKRCDAEIVREITSADLILLDLDRGVKAPTIRKLRDAHHSIARLVAQGTPGSVIAQITGYSQSRISILKGDPSFAELVRFYANRQGDVLDEAFSDRAAKLAAVNSDAIEELHDRILDEPAAIPTDELIDIVKVTSDRTGLGPQSKSTNLNVNVDLSERVANGRARAERTRLALTATPAGVNGKTEGVPEVGSPPSVEPPPTKGGG